MPALGPLRLEPIFKSMLWGGSRLPAFVRRPAPHADPIGEAWMLSDVDGDHSVIAAGAFEGRTLRDVIEAHPAEIFGDAVPADGRFPLLFKFLDAKRELSVQVHPNDEQAVRLKGDGHRGKTEAWVILDADPQTSRLYSGFRDGVAGSGNWLGPPRSSLLSGSRCTFAVRSRTRLDFARKSNAKEVSTSAP